MLMKPATPFATLRSLDFLMCPTIRILSSIFVLRLIVIFRSLLGLSRLAGFARFTRFPVLVLSASILGTTHTNVGDLALQLLNLTLLLGLGIGLFLAQDAKDVLQSCPPVVDSVGQLLVLLLTEHTVCDLVNEELLALLGKFTLDEASANHIDSPHLNLILGDLQSLGDLGVFNFAARSGSGQAGECQEAHLAVELLVVQALLLNPTLVLIVEVVVVLKILLSKDIKKLRVDGEVVAGGEGLLDSTEGQSLGVFGGDSVAVECSEGLDNVLVGLPVECLFEYRKQNSSHAAYRGVNLLLLTSLKGNFGDLLVDLSLEIGIGSPSSEPLGELIEVCAQTLKHGMRPQELENLHKDTGADGVAGFEQVEDGGQGVE
ncbi:hypothetical protein HG531_011992 [Fusarium graminearum]|nr:hypothetical protein HG531_011992 [Fusarium graminearum]